jgi:hypothetical protein
LFRTSPPVTCSVAPGALKSPAPATEARLPLTVAFVSVVVPDAVKMPPPRCASFRVTCVASDTPSAVVA